MPAFQPIRWNANVVVASTYDNESTLNWSVGTQASAVALSTTVGGDNGTQAVRFTYSGTTTGALGVNNSTDIPVVAGTVYHVTWAAYVTVAAVSVAIDIDWYTAAQVFISTSSTSAQSLTANVWNPIRDQSATTPATAAFARANVRRTAGLTTGNFVYIDSMAFATRFANPSPAVVCSQPMRSATW